jgi:hypothetical protein
LTKYLPILAALLLLVSCGDGGTQTPTYQTAISACGGFGATAVSLKGSDESITETLDWSYDAGTGLVTIINHNVCINCCGIHSMKANDTGEGFEVTEVDLPQDGGMRCSCDCNFDFSISLPAPADGYLKLDLSRDVKESGVAPVWHGTLHLSDKAGSIVIRSDFMCI